MMQGEIWDADLNPAQGSEQAGRRPVLIISGNLMNKHLPIVICCPITSKVKNYMGNLVLEPNAENGLKSKSEVLTFHIRSISKTRLVKKRGNIQKEGLEQIQSCLQDILTL
jgi:mRNA interferase MazF